GVAMASVTQESYQRESKYENCWWHLRFGHLNFGGFNLLHGKGMVNGLLLIEKPDNLYEGCILGKQQREI
ncbi:GAG-pre-integrase domain-containing protein, partial [Bacteroides uniformis]|uniref:GAG-pre-integrase domain-containing protein n=1 Tax=Bacteroides uniformis TaxID=820 RepID=UPI001AA1C838